MSAITKAFAKVIQARRHDLGISQENLAFRAKLHRTYISQLERGIKSPTLNIIYSIAQALEIAPHLLLFEAEKLINEDAQISND